jgi:hypothetical protein
VKRRSAIALGVPLVVACAFLLIGLSALLAADRRADRDSYQNALLGQRRAAGLSLHLPGRSSPEKTLDKEFCVRGVETFASVLHSGLGRSVIDSEGKLQPEVLASVSDLATRAERYAEVARAEPALPQRLGRQRDEAGAWRPLQPDTLACESGDAFVAFRVILPAEPRKEESESAPTGSAPTRTTP